MTTPDLFARREGTGSPIVLLHGLFGASGNLGALARALRENFTVVSPDLPGHGRSYWTQGLTLPVMAQGVRRLMDAQGLASAHVLGHSLGGKVAMQLALQYPARVESLVVVDIAPVRYTARHEQVFTALEAVVQRHCTSREEAAACMAPYLREEAVIQFLLASLRRDAQGIYRWRFDLEGLRAAYPALLGPPQGGQPYDGPALFIRGGASDYVHASDWPAVQAFFPRAALETMADCGHWLHVEQPVAFNDTVQRFLAPLEHRKLAAG